jgi:excinuclease ABC subunit C
MRRTLGIVRRIFTVRSCADDLPRERRERPCLDFHIGRCKAPCVGWQPQEDYRAMIGEVVAFLEGDTADVRGRLREMMTTAADREDFERAKELRDTLKWVEQLESPGTVEQVGSGDADVIGFARDGDDAAVTFFRVRDGRVLARDHRFLENVEGETDETILSAWLVQEYRLAQTRARRVVLPFPPDDLEQLSQLIPDAEFHVPQRGAAGRWRDLADQNARHLLESLRIESFETDERAEDPVYALGRDLGLQVVPRSLICVDISTNQGRDTVGSLVWFEAGRPKKAEYRKFKIKGIAQQDDFAAIHEVVTRFLTRRRDEKKPFPDLIVIDGGKGQLSAARGALVALALETIPLISLAKREEEVFIPGREGSLRLPRRSPSLRLLQRARDEAHRFGVAFNRKRRAARTITSELLEIPGVGPTKRRKLLETFGSLAGVKSATPIEIAAVPGFSQKLAERVLDHLKEG